MKNVLVIDDDFISSELIKHSLPSHSYNVNVEYAGDTGVEAFRRSSNVNIVLLDLCLPNLSGFQVFEKIKEINPNVRIVAYTAVCDKLIEEKCAKMGFDDFIQKPLISGELVTRLKVQ